MEDCIDTFPTPTKILTPGIDAIKEVADHCALNVVTMDVPRLTFPQEAVFRRGSITSVGSLTLRAVTFLAPERPVYDCRYLQDRLVEFAVKLDKTKIVTAAVDDAARYRFLTQRFLPASLVGVESLGSVSSQFKPHEGVSLPKQEMQHVGHSQLQHDIRLYPEKSMALLASQKTSKHTSVKINGLIYKEARAKLARV